MPELQLTIQHGCGFSRKSAGNQGWRAS
jgi:hypothetical protein